MCAFRSKSWCIQAVVAVFVFYISTSAQNFAPPKGEKPNPKILKYLTSRTEQLGKAIASLRRQGVRDPWLADIEVYHKAANWILKHNEFFQKESAEWTDEAISRGMLRARLTAQGQQPNWVNAQGYTSIRAYRSRIDGSVQPFAVTLPADYGKEPGKTWRVDVVLHGRDRRLNEVKFLHAHNGDKPIPKDQSYVQIDVYGRGNNAYRWAGETDVFEALQHFYNVEKMLGRGDLIDTNKIVLRGFSMGGAGTWHLGLHHPDQWRVISPGAGFTTTHGYVKNLPKKLPPHQEACLHIYDAVDYAANAFHVPVVAYSGEKDAQRQAAENMDAKFRKLGLKMTHLIAPGLGHQFPPEWRQKAEGFIAKHIAEDQPEFVERVKFVTYTLRYPSCHWVKILGLNRHYRRATIDAKRTENGVDVKTENIRAFRLVLPPGTPQYVYVRMNDKQKVLARPRVTPDGLFHVYLEKRGAIWHSVLPQVIMTERARTLQKAPGLQGPIEDAFTDGFLCVRGTGKPWHESTGKYADAALERLEYEWSKYWRGDLPVKDDLDVTDQDIASKHLILFGDPSSNSLITQALRGLPLQWNADELTFGDKKYGAKDHVPVMIYPSPFNGSRYVVLNTGPTFHEKDYRGTNALLFPRLGDYAVLRIGDEQNPLATEVATAGLFDDWWSVSGERE